MSQFKGNYRTLVLVIDDDVMIQQVLQRILSQYHGGRYSVVRASNGDEARLLIDRLQNVLLAVVSDQQFPGGPGHKIHQEVQDVLKAQGIGWVAISGDWEGSQEATAHYDEMTPPIPRLDKPFNANDLMNTVAHQIVRSQVGARVNVLIGELSREMKIGVAQRQRMFGHANDGAFVHTAFFDRAAQSLDSWELERAKFVFATENIKTAPIFRFPICLDQIFDQEARLKLWVNKATAATFKEMFGG